METDSRANPGDLAAHLDSLLPDLESIYKDLHTNPELSMQEVRTARIAADSLRSAGYEVTPEIGKTGVVGVLRNGTGPTVMLRRYGRAASRWVPFPFRNTPTTPVFPISCVALAARRTEAVHRNTSGPHLLHRQLRICVKILVDRLQVWQ